MYYRKTLYGYNKKGIEEAKALIEARYNSEIADADEEIREALNEQEQLLNKLNAVITETKTLHEHARQVKQLKEYMPYIVSQKKTACQKEMVKVIGNTAQYMADVQKHISAIDSEIEKVKQRVRTFMASVTQLLVLRNVKEYDELLGYYSQLLEKIAPPKNSQPASVSSGPLYDDLLLTQEIEVQSTECKLEEGLPLGADEQLEAGFDADFLIQCEGAQIYDKMPQLDPEKLLKFDEERATKTGITAKEMPLKEGKAISQNTILFAEYDKEMAELLKHLFEREGYNVIYAPDGKDAYDLINSMEPPQIVLLNMMLPYYDGYQLISHIRADKGWGVVPIVAITSNQAEWDTVNILNAGANDVIRKPYSPREILARIRRHSVANEKVI